MKLEDRVAVITGAGSGIGRAMALCFAREGARVVASDIDRQTCEETVRLVEDEGREAFAFETDVSSRESVARLFKETDRRGWPVDILINNAGNSEEGLIPIWETSDERWDSVMDVHLKGTFYCSREALKRMVPRKTGSIINIGSVAGLTGLPGACSYTAAKGGIIALTKGLAQECARVGIRVNCIAPGWVETPILNTLPEKWRTGMVKSSLLGRIGRPEEIAMVALFLASDDASFVIGQVISPNGGVYL